MVVCNYVLNQPALLLMKKKTKLLIFILESCSYGYMVYKLWKVDIYIICIFLSTDWLKVHHVIKNKLILL